jgi:hypothetical protein
MKTALATTLRESCGYLADEGWHKTAQLMTLAADELDRLNARVQELETARASAEEIGSLWTPDASNQNLERIAAAARR